MNSISSATTAPAPLQPSKAYPAAQAPERAPAASVQASTAVSISSEARAAAAKEAAETPAETAREASGGDRQAQHLLARHVAAGGAASTTTK